MAKIDKYTIIAAIVTTLLFSIFGGIKACKSFEAYENRSNQTNERVRMLAEETEE